MKAIGNKRFLISTIVLMLIISSCQNSSATIDNELIVDNSYTPELNDENITSQITETISPVEEIGTPTPDLRTPANQWQEWPIVPEVTNRSYEIYSKGVENEVDPHAFSKIGDCQNVKEAFLGIYDKEGRYFLSEEESSWQLTIDNFDGFFDKDGLAIEQGLNVAAALSTLHADPNYCEPGESPVKCELRVTNPSFAFISFERWWPKITPPEQYEKYLRNVIQETIDNGTVPILITKADNVEGDHQINQIIANLVFEYDIPLYNWWKAAQLLPHRGLDPERNDGFHISIEAWDSRSYYALETLDYLWKGLNSINE